ncbi:MAG: hypothetical protein ACKO1N_07880 [Erythrobacter sp.]
MKKSLALDPIAMLTHDLGSTSPLQSWLPVPAADLHQGEQLAVYAYGTLAGGIRSPRHLYAAMWRDPYQHAVRERDKAPTGILLFASFGIAPYELSSSLMETAEMFNRLDRASLTLSFVQRGEDDCELASLTLEISDPAKELRCFRSCWEGDEIAALDLAVHIAAPATLNDPVRFHVQGRLPRRYNHGARIEQQCVGFTASGGAVPMPDWVNY